MKRSTNLLSLSLCFTALGLSLALVGCSDSDDNGSLTFKVINSGSPADPQIFIPEATKNIKLEVFQEPSVTGKKVSFSNSATSENDQSPAEDQEQTESKAKTVSRLADQGKPLYAFGTSSKDKDKKESGEKTYYSASVAYEGGEPELSLEGIQDGDWVVRVSALDSNNNVLAYYQDGLAVNGDSRSIKGWLQPGAAPSGYLYAAHTANGTISRVSLYSNLIDSIKLNSGNPAYLFAKRTEKPSFSDLFYATTGGVKILQLTPSFVDKKIDVEDIAFPTDGAFVRSSQNGDSAVVSFFKEGLVRFFDFTQQTNYDYVYTGSGANYISHLTNNSQVWVCNENEYDLSLVDINNHNLVYTDNLRLGGDIPKAAEPNSDNSKVWVIGTRSSGGFVRAVDFSEQSMGGRNWGEFTTDLASPGAIYLASEALGCVTDNTRGELIFLKTDSLDDQGNISEIFGKSGSRLALQGGGDQILSDGARLYILQMAQGKVAVVDLETKAIATSYNLGSNARSLMFID